MLMDGGSERLVCPEWNNFCREGITTPCKPRGEVTQPFINITLFIDCLKTVLFVEYHNYTLWGLYVYLGPFLNSYFMTTPTITWDGWGSFKDMDEFCDFMWNGNTLLYRILWVNTDLPILIWLN